MSATQQEDKHPKANPDQPDGQGDKAEKNHFGMRFKQWRQVNGISAYRIAKMTGVHPSFISNIEASRRPMSDSFMRKLATISEFGISYETLRAWKIQAEYDIDEMKEALQNAMKEGQKEVDSFMGDPPLDTGHYLHWPIQYIASTQGLVQAPDKSTSKAVNWVGIRRNNPNIFCIQIQDSSLWPPIPKNAIMLVQKNPPQILSGKKYLVEQNNQLAMYEFDGEKLVPMSANASAKTQEEVASGILYQIMAFKMDWHFS